MFKRSPTSNDNTLQKYVKAEFGKELSLLLDCKTRWSSLWTMLERFQQLRDCVFKSLIDMKNPLTFSADECKQIDQLVSALEPIKATVEALCRRDANLLTAETALKFLMETLLEQEESSALAKQLVVALRRRISERRRSKLTGLLRYLHNPNVISSAGHDEDLSSDFETLFDIPSSGELKRAIVDLVTRLTPHKTETPPSATANSSYPDAQSAESTAATSDKNVNATVAESGNIGESTRPFPVKALTVAQRLQLAIESSSSECSKPRFMSDTHAAASWNEKAKVIRAEMSLFEGGGQRGLHLDMAYNCLLTIPPSSVESERVFSSAGVTCSKLRTRMSDSVLDDLLFIRSYFKASHES